jgi:SagB-type dehydrogenase family enzyme
MSAGILGYHERSKHHPERYARSPGYMDWANQPQPFRFYAGAPVVPLPLLARDPPAGHLGLYEPAAPAAAFTREHIAGFLELSMGLSAWKAASGSRWPLRINPSSGNLHPTETHLVLPPLPGLAGGVYHYDPLNHALERRAGFEAELWQPARRHFGGEGFLALLTSIYWRESWKYGERAFRYCNHDTGHALAALRFSANLFGWRLQLLDMPGDDALEALLGFGRTEFPPLESEAPELACWVWPADAGPAPAGIPDELPAAFAGLEYQGRPNRLSRKHVDWEVLYRAAAASRKPSTPAGPAPPAEPIPWTVADESRLGAAAVIRRRRSATAFDRNSGLPRRHFLAMLDKTLPRGGKAPFDTGPGRPAVHLLLFVHHVDDLAAGLYFFCRNDAHLAEIRALAKPDFRWEVVEPGVPLFRLSPGDFRRTAIQVSCHQEIAGDSAFSLGMLARFDEQLASQPYRYRRLFWETGMIGQVLYLEAEAHAARGTGIGCYFDDAVHELMGLETGRFQSLYHFTVGIPLDDPRLSTYPPYDHLEDRKKI